MTLRFCESAFVLFPCPSIEHTFMQDCDVSDTAIGCELSQFVAGKEHIFAYESFVLTPTQCWYCTTHKELLTVQRFGREFRHYL